MINQLLSTATGIRPHAKGKRTNLMQCHGLRKFFATTISDCGVDSVWCEMLLGHRTGLKEVYNKPKPMTILQGNDKMNGYASAINHLTINQENELRSEVAQLTAKVNEVEKLKKQLQLMEEQNKNVIDMMIDIKKFVELGEKSAEHLLKPTDASTNEERGRLIEAGKKLKKHHQQKYNLQPT